MHSLRPDGPEQRRAEHDAGDHLPDDWGLTEIAARMPENCAEEDHGDQCRHDMEYHVYRWGRGGSGGSGRCGCGETGTCTTYEKDKSDSRYKQGNVGGGASQTEWREGRTTRSVSVWDIEISGPGVSVEDTCLDNYRPDGFSPSNNSPGSTMWVCLCSRTRQVRNREIPADWLKGWAFEGRS